MLQHSRLMDKYMVEKGNGREGKEAGAAKAMAASCSSTVASLVYYSQTL